VAFVTTFGNVADLHLPSTTAGRRRLHASMVRIPAGCPPLQNHGWNTPGCRLLVAPAAGRFPTALAQDAYDN